MWRALGTQAGSHANGLEHIFTEQRQAANNDDAQPALAAIPTHTQRIPFSDTTNLEQPSSSGNAVTCSQACNNTAPGPASPASSACDSAEEDYSHGNQQQQQQQRQQQQAPPVPQRCDLTELPRRAQNELTAAYAMAKGKPGLEEFFKAAVSTLYETIATAHAENFDANSSLPKPDDSLQLKRYHGQNSPHNYKKRVKKQ